MSPEELADKHPQLYHVTLPEAVESIKTHGLLSTSKLLDLFGVPELQRFPIESQRRPSRVTITHPIHGSVVVTDNLPLTEKALNNCLDDGLTPQQWLLMLNARVFFWPDVYKLQSLLNARANRKRTLAILSFDTVSLARAHMSRLELCPINSGATMRKPARRGLNTFTPAASVGYADWRRRRKQLDSVKEIAIVNGVPDASQFLLSVSLHQQDTGKPL
jgi:hypothetical protein